MSHSKIHVRADNTATLICPACGTIKHFAAERFLHSNHTLAVRCRCQHEFTVLLDFRRHYRKQTSLPGTYEIVSEGGVGGGIIHINNISRGGVGFTVSGIHRIAKGQVLHLEFQLNDKKKTVLKKRVQVKSVHQNTIGCQFVDTDPMERSLGFFLQS